MLTLSRKAGEALIINDNVTVTVLEIRGDKVRLGIEAPADVGVWRSEIYVTLGQDIGDPEQAIHKAALAVRETVRNLEAD